MKAAEIFTSFTYTTVTFMDEHLKEKEVAFKASDTNWGA
jgi:hypothetical protein